MAHTAQATRRAVASHRRRPGLLPDLVAAAEPDGRQPQRSKNDAEPVHRRDHDPGRDQGRLEHGPGQERPALARPSHQARDHQGRGGQDAAGHARRGRAGVRDGDGHRDGQPDHDHLEDQDGRAQAPHGTAPPLAPSGAPPASTLAAPSSRRASPAVVVEPVTRIPALPGPSDASSASVVAASIASSSRGATTTRSGPNTRAASPCSSSGSMDLDAELRVTTRPAAAGSSCSSIPVTSLSALTASTATRVPKPNASVTASTLTAMPAGLCAESTITTGLRRTTSSRPGAVMAANACRTRSPSSGPVPAKASTAARAHAAFCAWYAPNSGSSRSG